MESNEILTMRGICWSRAKGELQAMLHTFWPEYSGVNVTNHNSYKEISDEVKAFIKKIDRLIN